MAGKKPFGSSTFKAGAGPVNANVSQMSTKPTPMASSLGGQFSAMENALMTKPKRPKKQKIMI